jgi:sulfonate transport system substrate-binding protein
MNTPFTSTVRTRRQRLGLVAGAAVLSTLAVGCASSSSSSTPVPGTANAADTSGVTLRVGDQKGTGAEALLQAAGLLKTLPFKLQFADFTSGPPMMQAMGSGSLDVGGVGDSPPVFAAAGGEKIAVVGATLPKPASAAILVPKGSPITSVAGLRGKTIAVAQGSSADYELLAALTKAGLTVKDVKLTYLQPGDALAAFASHHVAAWAVWSPYIEQAETQDGAKALVNGKGYGGNYSFTVASRSALDDPTKAAEIKTYLATLDKARDWANAHPAAWAKAWAGGAGFPVSVMTTAAKDTQATVVPINAAVIAFEQQVANAFSNAGLIPTKVDFNDFADQSFNSTVTSH